METDIDWSRETMETRVELSLVFIDSDKLESTITFTAPTVDLALEKLGAWERATKNTFYGGNAS